MKTEIKEAQILNTFYWDDNKFYIKDSLSPHMAKYVYGKLKDTKPVGIMVHPSGFGHQVVILNKRA